MHFSELDGSKAAGAVLRFLMSSHGKSQLYHIQLGHFRHGVGGDFPWEDSRDLHTAPVEVEPSNSEKCMMNLV